MADKTIGLTLGKFAPLHKGHQFLIESAMKKVDELIVLIYDTPEIKNVPPLSLRAKWIKELYPNAEVIEAWTAPSETGYTPEIMKKQEEFIQKILGDKKISYFFASEPYVQHVSKALGAKAIMVDQKRTEIPISATRVRLNAYMHKQFLDPVVYHDLVANIVFLGGPSTGKSTLVEALAKEYHTQWMPEYGREYWDKHQIDHRITTQQLVELAKEHIERENTLLEKANTYLFTDTNAITTYLFSLHYHGRAENELLELAKQCSFRYDLVFLCDTDIPYDDTWDRSGDASRVEMQRRTISFLQEYKIPYIKVHGSLEERIHQVKHVLEHFNKYDLEMHI
jgi:HTH-type transcriptional regulator, transcriptional repressor of NAD biosynthesis genes